MTPKETIQYYVFRHYGNLTRIGDINHEDESGKWIAELKSDYPRWFKDDRAKKEPILRFISMDNIGEIVFDKNMQVLQATTRSECGDRIWDRLGLWRDDAERIMVEASADQLAMARGADQFLSPIVTILDNLQNPLYGRPVITRDDINTAGPDWLKYLSLLEDVEIVRSLPEEKAWTYGPMFTVLLEKATERHMAFERAVFAHLLKNRYPAIRDILRIGIFEKIIHLDSSYYWQALDAEEPIAINRNNLFSRYRVQYDDEEADNFTLNSKLQELSNVHAIKIEGDYCVAEDGILKEMLVLKHNSAQRGGPPRA
jgi:hypothetical protein